MARKCAEKIFHSLFSRKKVPCAGVFREGVSWRNSGRDRKTLFAIYGWSFRELGHFPDYIYLSLTGLLTAIRGLNIYSHLYLRVLSPPGPCQALTINYNNQTIWILKLSLFSPTPHLNSLSSLIILTKSPSSCSAQPPTLLPLSSNSPPLVGRCKVSRFLSPDHLQFSSY